MTRHNRHNGLLPATTCYKLFVYVADLLWTCYEEVANLLWTCRGETGVMDFGLKQRELTHSESGDIASVRLQKSRSTRSIITHDCNPFAFT